jgi:hypothetical protein
MNPFGSLALLSFLLLGICIYLKKNRRDNQLSFPPISAFILTKLGDPMEIQG